MIDSKNCSTLVVQSLIHLASPPTVNTPPVPFLLNARISLAPTHLASQIALDVGMFLLRQWSRRILPRIPCGMVRLSRRRGIEGFARSLNHASRLVSVRVTRGGGLNVLVAVMVPWTWRLSSVETNNDERICRPDLCFKL